MRRLKIEHKALHLLLPVIFSLIISCGGGAKNEKKADKVDTENVISQGERSVPLFNGKDLSGWEITNFAAHGPVNVSEGTIVLGMGEGCTGITYTGEFPEMNYRVTLDAMRIEGTDFFCGMTFPVGEEFCTLIVGGWAGATVGLSSIDGYDASENETTEIMNLEDNKWYNICLSVEEDSIKAWIDNRQVIAFKKNGKKLSVRSEVEESKPFGIASWYTSAVLKNITVERLK